MKTLQLIAATVSLLFIIGCGNDTDKKNNSEAAPVSDSVDRTKTKNLQGSVRMIMENDTVKITDFDQIESGVNFESDVALYSLRSVGESEAFMQIRVSHEQLYKKNNLFMNIPETKENKNFVLFYRDGGTPPQIIQFAGGEIEVRDLSDKEFNAQVSGEIYSGAGSTRKKVSAEILIQLNYDKLDSDKR